MQSEKKLTIIILFFVSILICTTGASAQPTQKAYKSGELLVVYKNSRGPVTKSAMHGTGIVRKASAIGHSRIHRITLEPGTTVEQARKILADDPDIEIAEPNYLIYPQVMPNDTEFSKQWGLYSAGQQAANGSASNTGIDIDAPQAWNIATDSTDVVVAVLDTGCNMRHPDLAPNIWTNAGEIAGDGIDNDHNGFIDDTHGWDFANENNDPSDATGHGTHVAGIIAAAGNNQRGITGVAWKASIMPVRIMNSFDIGTTADAIKAINYAVNNGAKIINCSWGSTSYSSALRFVIENADALFICAAGNNGKDADSASYYPASYSAANIISVAATNNTDNLSWFSNFGTVTTDVAAPGEQIYSLGNRRNVLWAENFNDGVLNGWITGGSNDEWEITAPPGRSGESTLATSPIGDNVNDADTWAQPPPLNLVNRSATMLTFRHLGSNAPNPNRLYLEISTNGQTWSNLVLKIGGKIHSGGITGSAPYWMIATADLGLWDGQPQVYLRFRFSSGSEANGAGYNIDDIKLTVADDADSYQYMQGTSMAAAFVSGLTALIQSQDLELTTSEIKFIVVHSVDLKQNLLEKVSSGGRVNIYNALTLLRELNLNADMVSGQRVELSWSCKDPLSGSFTIQRRTGSQTEFNNIADVEADIYKFVDANVDSEGTYYYRVQAQTSEGNYRYSHQTLAGSATSKASGSGGGGGCFISTLGGS